MSGITDQDTSSKSFLSDKSLQQILENRVSKKIAIFGYYDVGKTSFISKFHLNHFPNNKLQYNYLEGIKSFVNYNKQKIELEIKDTNSYDEYSALLPQNHSYQIEGYILLYSVDNRNSFVILQDIREKLYQLNGSHKPTILVGNKNDIQDSKREVSYPEGSTLADQWGIPFEEISVQFNTQQRLIQDVIDILLQDIHNLEFPHIQKKNFYDIRKMKQFKRKKILKIFNLFNILMMVVVAIFLLYIIIEGIPNAQIQGLQEFFLILCAVISIITQVIGLISSIYIKEDLIIAYSILSIIESVFQIIIICLYSFQTQQNSESQEKIDLTVNITCSILLIINLILKVLAGLLIPFVYKIIKFQKNATTFQTNQKTSNDIIYLR